MEKGRVGRVNLTIGFLAVFVLFTSDFYGLSDEGAETLRFVCIVLGFGTITISWLMGIHGYFNQKSREVSVWNNMWKIKRLLITATLFQLTGGIIGFLFLDSQWMFMDIWIGITVASFPSFLVGLYVEKIFNGSVTQDEKLTLLFGVVSGVLTLAGLVSLGFN